MAEKNIRPYGGRSRADGTMHRRRRYRKVRRPPAHYKKRRQKQKMQIIAAVLQTAVILAAVLGTVLMICGCLYIKEKLFPVSAEAAGKQNVDTAQEGWEADGNDSASRPEQQVVVVDAGHGGTDPGCDSFGVTEKDVTLAIALAVKEKLESQNITVVLTRSSDEKISLEKRIQTAKQSGADTFVSIHCNSYEKDESIRGLEPYYYQSDAGRALAEAVSEAAEGYSVKTRPVKEENYQVLRDLDIPAVLIETGYLTNWEECNALNSAEYQDIIAAAIADGILNCI